MINTFNTNMQRVQMNQNEINFNSIIQTFKTLDIRQIH